MASADGTARVPGIAELWVCPAFFVASLDFKPRAPKPTADDIYIYIYIYILHYP